MPTQDGTNASNSMKLASTINQNKTNFTYDTKKTTTNNNNNNNLFKIKIKSCIPCVT